MPLCWTLVLKLARRWLLMLLAAGAFVASANAHTPSKSYLSLVLTSNEIDGQWDIPLADLRTVVPLDVDKDGVVTWEELRGHYPALVNYARARLKITADGQSCAIRFTGTEPAVGDFNDGPYLELPFVVDVRAQPEMLELDYRLFFEVNSLHRGLLRLEAGDKTQSAIFSPDDPVQRFNIGEVRPGRQFLAFLKEGINHIWTGYDHILFLLALLLPSVLSREGGGWRGVAQFRPAVLSVFKIVTAFTVAHSITLSLATLNIVRLPPRLSESAIAASVILAAANNLRPVVRERGWIAAFVFGLIHGFGFANALSELGLANGTLLLTLVGFNLGVEIGQLAIVGVFLPLAYAMRRSWFYQTPVLLAGSGAIMLVAGVWLAERACNLRFPPF